MSRRFARMAVAMLTVMMLLIAAVPAAQALSAGVMMTVSRTTQDSVINEGENLTIDVQLDGVEPARYIWYFEGNVIDGASGSVYSVTEATVQDAGLYRVEAYSEDGTMLMLMEFDLRVIDKALPKSGDNTPGAGVLTVAFLSCSAAAAALIVRRRLAA